MSGHRAKAYSEQTTCLAEGVKDVVEIGEYFTLRDLGDVVHRLASVVPDSGILIAETSYDRRHNAVEVPGELLRLNGTEVNINTGCIRVYCCAILPYCACPVWGDSQVRVR